MKKKINVILSIFVLTVIIASIAVPVMAAGNYSSITEIDNNAQKVRGKVEVYNATGWQYNVEYYASTEGVIREINRHGGYGNGTYTTSWYSFIVSGGGGGSAFDWLYNP